jgi:outer membrane immunogenic protein
MKRVLLTGVAMTALSLVSANAADLGARYSMPAKAPAYVAPHYNWTGFYIGLSGGGAWGKSEWSSPAVSTGNFDVDGALIGGTVGYNWQFGRTVLGIEGDLSWTNIDGSVVCTAGGLRCNTENNWLGTVRGRAGYAFDRFLPYLTAGLAVGDVRANLAGFTHANETNAGWTVGAGVEFAVAGPWTAKVEYLHVDLGDINCPAANCGTPVTGIGTFSPDFTANVVRVGLNYRF